MFRKRKTFRIHQDTETKTLKQVLSHWGVFRTPRKINLCEMKYASEEFVIYKNYDEILQNKRSTFRSKTKTKNAIHITLITTYGVKRNEYWGNIQSEVTKADLFALWFIAGYNYIKTHAYSQ
jgi:hypothetical protein